MTRDEAWLEGVIRRATTVEECKLAVSVYLVERGGGHIGKMLGTGPAVSHFTPLRLVRQNTDDNNATR